MEKVVAALAVALLSLSGVTPNVQAGTIFTSGAMCQAANPSNENGMRWSYEGLANSRSGDSWVVCAVPHDVLSQTNDTEIGIMLENNRSSVTEVLCFFRYASESSDDWVTVRRNIAISAGDGEAEIVSIENELIGFPSVTCRIPPSVSVLGIIADTTY